MRLRPVKKRKAVRDHAMRAEQGAAPMQKRKDLTIDEAIRDPMIRLVMKADGIDPKAFERLLRSRAADQALDEDLPSSFLQDSGSGRTRRLRHFAKPFGEASASW
jgi:coproporphyrinogen III oxidase-like Fe-S oxidoreductase